MVSHLARAGRRARRLAGNRTATPPSSSAPAGSGRPPPT